MRNTTWCCAISARAVSGSLMSSAGATTTPQPMLSGSQMSMTLPSVRQSNAEAISSANHMHTREALPSTVCAVASQGAQSNAPKMKGIVWKNMEPTGMGEVRVR